MSKSIKSKVRSQQAYNAKKMGNKAGLPPRVGKSLHSFLLLNKVNRKCGCNTNADVKAPVVVGASILLNDSSTSIGFIVEFDESLFGNTLNASNYKVTFTQSNGTTVVTKNGVSSAIVSNGKLHLTTNTAPQPTCTSVSLHYTPGAAGTSTNLKDKFGNEVAESPDSGNALGDVAAPAS